MNYLLFSKPQTNGIAMWWRPNAAGYTNDLNAAGRYSKEDAESHCCGAQGFVVAVEELAAYRLATRTIVDMGDGANYAMLMSPNTRISEPCKVEEDGLHDN